jgi:AcrR family transcriptional regulator
MPPRSPPGVGRVPVGVDRHDAAAVAKMTVTNCYPRKEDLVFDRAEAIIRTLADVITSRAPGESLLTAIRRDYAERVARADVTIGLSGPEFARLIENSPVLVSRALKMLSERERVLGAAASQAFDLLEPVLGGYLVRPEPE